MNEARRRKRQQPLPVYPPPPWTTPTTTELKSPKRPLTSAFDNFNIIQRLGTDNDQRTNTDNEYNRFGSGESVVPLPSQAQQAELAVRDVLPQPVDGEFTSVADLINDTTVNMPTEPPRDRRQGEGVALLCPGRRPIQTMTSRNEHSAIDSPQHSKSTSCSSFATRHTSENSRRSTLNIPEINKTTQSLSPVPAVVGSSGVNSVVVSAMAGTVGQDAPQVSLSYPQPPTGTAAPAIFPGKNPTTELLSPGEGPSTDRRKNITQSLSPVPAVVGMENSSVMASTAAGTVGQGVPQASCSQVYPLTEATAAPSPFPGVPPSRRPPTRRASASSSSSATASAPDGHPSGCLALQWNVRGLRANISELKLLISKLEPCVIALQETKVNQTAIPPDFVGKNYTLLLESSSAHYWQHGVGLAIREGIPFERMQLDTTMHLVAARIHAPIQATVVSVYIPPSSLHCEAAMSELFDQLQGPVLLLGDFNAHHPAWGSQSSNALGRFIAETTLDKQLVILNNGSPTRIDPATGNTSAIDLSLSSESLARRFIWRTLSDTHSSDHFPITVSIPGWSYSPTTRKKWLYDSADWASYERITATTIRPDVEWDVSRFTEEILAAAKKSIPQSSGRVGPNAVPWWCPEVKAAIKLRRKFLRSLRRLQPSHPGKSEALARFKEARTAARKAIIQAKQQSWEDFVAKISPDSTTTELWRTVNTLRGSRQQRTIVLKRADGCTDDPEKAAEELAHYYSERSATSSYAPSFQIAKEEAERESMELSLNTDGVYNTDITLSELLWALDKGRGVSTGPDMIGYPMLQRLPLSVKMTLLELLNKIWHSGEFPTSWRTAVVVPIPKPHCNDSGPAAFRPISLTSCMAKLLERIINRRLITELESNGRLDKRQHAFRSGRGTDTYFTELENSLPTRDEHCLIASLDLSKAYDTTWRHGILRTLRSWQIGGRMFNMLQSFLSDRKFQVSVGRHTSREHHLENGVPQGSVLSVTLFLIAMQPIFGILPDGVEILLYADDILLVVRGRKTDGLRNKLQAAVNAVDHWAKSVGFTISATKSYTFYCSPNARQEPKRDITIDQDVVPRTNQLRILGVILDRTLTFKPHCKMAKKACEPRLRILKMIGAKLPRGKRTTLLQVGSALVTSKLVYGIGLVSRGGPAVLQTLAPAYNKMVRFASGAFVTSPINSIMAEAGTLPFELLAAQSIARIAIRMRMKNRCNNDLPLIQRASDRITELTGTVLPTIAHLVRQSDREWHAPKPSIVWDVKRKVQAGDPPEKVRPVVQQLLSTRFQQSTIVYTDGSKCDETVGAGLFGNGLARMYGLPQQCSVFSAEAYAIKMAMSIPNLNQLVILTDSASCLLALEAGKSKHPWIQEVEAMARNRPVRFCWIPGHAGIRGNVEADKLANEARRDPALTLAIPAEDALRSLKAAIRQRWDNQWFAFRDIKLREVKCDTRMWTERDNAADQRVLTRLRIGHTRLTHTFLLKREPPPNCETCGTVIDVRHILLQCRRYEAERQQHDISTTSIRDVLCNAAENESRLLNYLRETGLYKQL